jgi:FkbM family methyltransferase
MSAVRQTVKRLAERAGYRITRIDAPPRPGEDAGYDIRTLLENSRRPMILDVGANTGQSVSFFRGWLPDCQIHCFEPGTSANQELERNTAGLADVRINHVGVGATPGLERLVEYEDSATSSFLPADEDGGGTVIREVEVPVITLDDYCSESGIEWVDLLKSDTQGYDLEVLKGADRLLRDGRIRLVYTEVIFSRLYENMATLDVLYRYLTDRGMRLVRLYNYEMDDGVAGWCDALFTVVA